MYQFVPYIPRKPATIQALQYDGTDQCANFLIRYSEGKHNPIGWKTIPFDDGSTQECLVMYFPDFDDGWIIIHPGNYVVQHGEIFLTVHQFDRFEKTYIKLTFPERYPELP